jgi:hypothetical protein
MSLAKPSDALLRNPLRNSIKKHILIALGLSVVAGYGYKHFISDWRKQKYQEFYRYKI